MPTTHARKVALANEFARFVDDPVAGGSYNDASEVVRDAPHELQRRTHADRQTESRAQIGPWFDQLDCGEGRSGVPAVVLGETLQEAKLPSGDR